MADSPPAAAMLKTPLHSLHVELGAKMVPFAGYDMPVSYPAGIMAEHRQCREAAALFDVSHMGQVASSAPTPRRARDAGAGRRRRPGVGKQRYALFTNDAGGILDDLMVTRRADHLFLVVNAGCKAADIAHLRATIASRCRIEPMPDHALLALQGPAAAAVIGRSRPALARSPS
jgi:aminomethyltransferase